MRALIALLLAVGCKDTPKQAPVAAKQDAAAPPAPAIDWQKCDDALVKAASAPLPARVQLVLDGCRPCGDPKALLAWSTPAGEGGPKREQIERAMVACNAFCTGDAKLKFMSSLDKARDSNSRAPWRQLTQSCKEHFAGDIRFLSAPYLLLDRVARAAAARGGETANHLAAIELPLPPLTISGEGPALPELEGGVTPLFGRLQITLLGDIIHVGELPRAKLSKAGVEVVLGAAGYPGEAVKLADLGTKLRALVGTDKEQTLTLVAPHAMPAHKLAPVIAAASKIAPVHLAAMAPESPPGWPLPVAIPIALEGGGKDRIVVTKDMTVANLARELVKRAAQKQPRVGVTAK